MVSVPSSVIWALLHNQDIQRPVLGGSSFTFWFAPNYLLKTKEPERPFVARFMSVMFIIRKLTCWAWKPQFGQYRRPCAAAHIIIHPSPPLQGSSSLEVIEALRHAGRHGLLTLTNPDSGVVLLL